MHSAMVVAVCAAAVAAILGWFSPLLLARLPEPEKAEPENTEPEKRPYAELAAIPRLNAWFAACAAVIAGSVALVIGNDAILALWVYLSVLGVMLAFVDWHTRRLPYLFVAPSYLVVLVLLGIAGVISGDWSRVAQSLIAGVAVYVFYTLGRLIYRKGMAAGDVRLSGILGIALGWLGWSEVLVGIYMAFVFGAVLGMGLALLKIVDPKGFAFGPFMLLGAWFGVVAGPAVADWLL